MTRAVSGWLGSVSQRASCVRGLLASAASSGSRRPRPARSAAAGRPARPLFSQTPRRRTWIGVRLRESFRVRGDRRQRRRQSLFQRLDLVLQSAPAPRRSSCGRRFLSCVDLVLDPLRLRPPSACCSAPGRARCCARRSRPGRPAAGSSPSARSARACGCGSGRSRPSGPRNAVPMMSVRSVSTSLRLRAISGLPALRRTGPSRWKIDGGQALADRPGRSRRRRSARSRTGRTACRG